MAFTDAQIHTAADEAHNRNAKMKTDYPGVSLPSYCLWDESSVGDPDTWAAWWEDDDYEDDCYEDDCDEAEEEARARNAKMVAEHGDLPSYCLWDASSVGDPQTWAAWWKTCK